MAYLLGSLVGAFLIMGLLSRIAMRLLNKPMGDTPMRICVAAGAAYVVGIILYGMGNADGGPWNPDSSLYFYLIAAVAWVALDFRGLANRQEAARRAKRQPVI
jgi:predicted membrane channel-forming protein YqfA (hemolysin III family)